MNSFCDNLTVVDLQPYHKCYYWNQSVGHLCEIEWPCEVRQFLVSISSFVWITRGLLSYGTLVIIVLGLFLNILSLYNFISSGISKSGCGVYLISLAICDCLNLLTNYGIGIGRAYLAKLNDRFMESEWLCRWHGVFVEVFQLISAWIVVSFTVERCLAIWYPIIIRHTSRTRRAKKVIAWVVGILTVFSLSKLILTGFEKDSVFGYEACYSRRFRWHGVAYIRIAFQTWIPTILVFTFNLLIFWKLRGIKRKRRRLTEIKREAVNHPAATRQGSFLNRPNHAAPMLAAVSLAYLILVFPLGVAQTVELFWIVRNHKEPLYTVGDDVARQRFIRWKNTKLLLKYLRSFAFGLYQINFCVNFFLYFVAGVQFRVHLLKKFNQWKDFCSSDSNNGVGNGRETERGISGRGNKRRIGDGGIEMEPAVEGALSLLGRENMVSRNHPEIDSSVVREENI